MTKTEKEVLSLTLKGHKNSEIAILLGKTENCIKQHKYRLYKKLGVRNGIELVLKSKGKLRKS